MTIRSVGTPLCVAFCALTLYAADQTTAEANKRILAARASELAKKGLYAEAALEFEKIKLREPGKAEAGADRALDQAIRLALARCYFQEARFGMALDTYQKSIEDGYPDWGDLQSEVEATFSKWLPSHKSGDDFSRKLDSIVRATSKQFGTPAAESLLRTLARSLGKPARDAVADALVDLFADRSYQISEFAEVFAPGIHKDLTQPTADLDQWGAWRDVCLAYGRDEKCGEAQSLPNLFGADDAFSLFHSIRDSLQAERRGFDRVLSIFATSGPVTSTRALGFSRLLTRIASEMSTVARTTGEMKSSPQDCDVPPQATIRFRAAWLFDNRNLEAASQAICSLVTPESKEERAFASRMNAEIDDLFKWRKSAFILTAFKQRGQGGDFEGAVRTELALLNLGNATGSRKATLDALANAVLQQKKPVPATLLTLGQAVMGEQPALAYRLFRQAASDAAVVGDEALLRTTSALREKVVQTGTWQPVEKQKAGGLLKVNLPREGDYFVEGELPEHTTRVEVVVGSTAECQTGSAALIDIEQRIVHYARPGQPYFSARLQHALEGGSCVEVQAETGNSSRNPVRPSTSDWGAMRLYGRVGMEFFTRDVRPASGPAPPLAFYGSLNFDATLIPFRAPGRAAVRANRWPGGLNGFLEGRIDAISVALQLTQPAGVKSGYCGAQNTCIGPASLGRSVEEGFWAPFAVSRLHGDFGGDSVAFFVAPMAKIGIQERNGSFQTQAVHLTINGQPVIGNELRSGPFFYGAAGVRLGYLRYFDSEATRPISTAPVLLSFVDITAGRWQNFAAPGDHAGEARVPWRVEVKGSISVPRFPVFFGIYWNGGVSAPNDYRVFVGLRTEFAQMATKIRRSRKFGSADAVDR